MQRAGAGPGVGISLLLGWAALWTLLLAAGLAHAGHLRQACCCSAAYLLMQLELGLGAMESSWLRHFQKTSALLAIGVGIGNCWRLRTRSGVLRPCPRRGSNGCSRGWPAWLCWPCPCKCCSATRPASSTCSRSNLPSWH
ncbi:hypothetical protein LP420_01715 [Massilia sp. B-10]|nr:hypothetical protein LP420_01715 [Massilia sp. B-10]